MSKYNNFAGMLSKMWNIKIWKHGCKIIYLYLFGLAMTYIHIHFIHNWPLQSFSQVYDLASYTIHFCCVHYIIYLSGGTYSLKSTPTDRFFRNFFMAGLFTLRIFFQQSAEGGSHRRIICIFSSWCLTWDFNSGLMSNKL